MIGIIKTIMIMTKMSTIIMILMKMPQRTVPNVTQFAGTIKDRKGSPSVGLKLSCSVESRLYKDIRRQHQNRLRG